MDVHGYQQCFEESASQVTSTPSVILGSRRIFEGEEFVYAYNAGNVQVSPSYGMRLVTGASGYSFDGASADGVANPCLGVVKHATITTGAYGWVMVKGFTSVECTPNSTITGNYIALSLRADGCFYQSLPLTDAVHVGTFAIVGYGLNVNTASGGSFYAMIKTGM